MSALKGWLTAAYTPGPGTSYTINMSAGITGAAIADGDFVFVFAEAAGSVANSKVPSAPAGFTTLIPFGAMGTSATSAWGLYVKKRTSGDGNYTGALDSTGSHTINSNFKIFWIEGSYRSDIPGWVIGSRGTRASSGGTVNNIAPSVTVTGAASVMGVSTERTAASEVETDSTVSGTGWTKEKTFLGVTAASSTITLATKEMTAAGATGDVTTTYINTQAANGEAFQIAIPSALVTVTKSFPMSWDVAADVALTTVTKSFDMVWSIRSRLTKSHSMSWNYLSTRTKRHTSTTVSEWLSRTPFYGAHRGGSVSYPEMSKYAYDEAVSLGYPMLELSLARTSDGVWFGLHDASLDRTSLQTGGGSGTTLVASSMTWAQVQAYQITAWQTTQTSQQSQPYMRWEEIIAAYYKTHVIFVDPKAAYSFRAELLDMMDACGADSTEHFIGKYFGVVGASNNSSGWAKDLENRGYQRWGYFYEGDVSNLPTYAPRWTLLGMDYNASQAAWDAILAYGKPVIAHICPNEAAVTTGLSRGASGFMVSATRIVSPTLSKSGMSWNVLQQATRSHEISWNVLQRLTKSLTFSSNVKETITKALAMSWNVRSQLTKSHAMSWNVFQRLTKSHAFSFNIRSRVTKPQDMSWNVRERITESFEMSWNVLEDVASISFAVGAKTVAAFKVGTRSVSKIFKGNDQLWP